MFERKDRPFLLLLLIVVIVNMGPGLIIPLMPILLIDYGFSTEGLSVAFFAILFARFLAQRFGGRAVTRIGAGRVLTTGLALYVLTMATYPFVDGRAGFVALRFVEGIFEGLAVVSINELAVALSTEERRGRQMGLFSSAFGLGLIIGPVVGGGLYDAIGMDAVFWGASLVAAVGTVLLVLSRKSFDAHSTKGGDRSPPAAKSPTPARGLGRLLGNIEWSLLAFYQPYILRRVLFFSLQMILPLYLASRFDVPPGQVGLYFALSAILSTILMPISGRIADRVDPKKILVVTLMTMALTITGFGFATSLGMFLALFVVEVIAFCFMLPTAMKVFSDLVADHPQRGEVLGNFGSLVDLASLLTPFVVLPLFGVRPAIAWGLLGSMCLAASVPFLLSRATDSEVSRDAGPG